MDVMVNFIWSDSRGIIIVTNKVALSLDFQTIKNYVKNAKHINVDGVEVPRLLQSKFYLKIIGISYLHENIVTFITLSMVKDVIKKNHIFNNIVLVSKPCIIKVSPKSDMAIIWVDIWDICYGMLWTLTFFFFFYLFFLILYFFFFWISFLFSFIFLLDDEEAYDIAVTWHVTWCDVIGLECSRRI